MWHYKMTFGQNAFLVGLQNLAQNLLETSFMAANGAEFTFGNDM